MLRSLGAVTTVALIASLLFIPLTLWGSAAGSLGPAVAEAGSDGPLGSISDISWSFGAAVPRAHQEGAGVKAKGKLYVISGTDVSCSDQGGGTVTTGVDIYDPASNTFSPGSDVNVGRTEAPAAVKVKKSVFLIGGVFTALAGFAFAINYQQVHPFMGEEVALKAISAMVIGGMGNIWGAILGGLAIGIVETAAIQWFGARTVDIWVYGLLLVILFFRPTGLLGGGTPAAGRV